MLDKKAYFSYRLNSNAVPIIAWGRIFDLVKRTFELRAQVERLKASISTIPHNMVMDKQNLSFITDYQEKEKQKEEINASLRLLYNEVDYGMEIHCELEKLLPYNIGIKYDDFIVCLGEFSHVYCIPHHEWDEFLQRSYEGRVHWKLY